jgi:hypothetical protein
MRYPFGQIQAGMKAVFSHFSPYFARIQTSRMIAHRWAKQKGVALFCRAFPSFNPRRLKYGSSENN